MPAIDGIMFAGMTDPVDPVTDPKEQSSQAVAPTEFNSSGDTTVKGILLTIVAFYLVIYAMTLVERWSSKK